MEQGWNQRRLICSTAPAITHTHTHTHTHLISLSFRGCVSDRLRQILTQCPSSRSRWCRTDPVARQENASLTLWQNPHY